MARIRSIAHRFKRQTTGGAKGAWPAKNRFANIGQIGCTLMRPMSNAVVFQPLIVFFFVTHGKSEVDFIFIISEG